MTEEASREHLPGERMGLPPAELPVAASNRSPGERTGRSSAIQPVADSRGSVIGERTRLPLEETSVTKTSRDYLRGGSILRSRVGDGDVSGHGPSDLSGEGGAPAHRFGMSLSDLFAHSWRHIPLSSWLWIPKSACVGELGFPASDSEIHRLGWQARVVKRIREPPPLHRSFAEVVRGEAMDQGRDRYPRRFGGTGHNIGGKRSAPEEWMEDEDLLLEEDLRSKLHRDQDQKRRNQESQYGGPQKTGTQCDYQEANRDRFDSRDYGGSGRGNPISGKGWQEDLSTKVQGRDGGLRCNESYRGNFRGGFG